MALRESGKSFFDSLFGSQSGAIIVGSIIISVSILLSGGIIKIKGLNSSGGLGTPSAVVPTQPTAPSAAAPEDTTPVQVALADAPVLGDKNAPVTMIEFSDYECPFCKSYFTSTYPQIKENYVDKGKVKVVFRNLPLSFHQNAHKEAQAALCVRDQGGDSVYYKYHDAMFTKTTSNGTGLALDQLAKIASEVGVDGAKVQSCLDSGKYKDYVDKDLAYASTVGANGTPTFFIGKSDSSGTITATRIVGAQPYASIQTVIDAALSK